MFYLGHEEERLTGDVTAVSPEIPGNRCSQSIRGTAALREMQLINGRAGIGTRGSERYILHPQKRK